jgi:hypothetical protein
MAQADNVEVVRMLWAAARKNDVDALLNLTAHDVDWRPTAVAASVLHGYDALRDYLDGLRVAGRLVDAHPYSFEAVGDCVIVSGALAPAPGGRRRGGDPALVGLSRGWREDRHRRQPRQPRQRLVRRARRAGQGPRGERPLARLFGGPLTKDFKRHEVALDGLCGQVQSLGTRPAQVVAEAGRRLDAARRPIRPVRSPTRRRARGSVT